MKLLVYVALILCVAAPCLRAEVGSDGRILNGMAPLYVAFPGDHDRAVRARLSLPDKETNKNWYANWVMIVGSSPKSNHQIFVQAGLIRRPPSRTLRYFISWQGPSDESIHYEEVDGNEATGTHLVLIRETTDGFAASIDGTALGRAIALSFSHAYAQIGPEVYQEGDALEGTVAEAIVSGAGMERYVFAKNVCHYTNHGVRLRAITGAYVADGVFDRNKLSSFEGDCRGL